MGPLLFILYVNDIVNSSQYIHFILYADDTTLLFHEDSCERLINRVNLELLNLSIWFKANKLSLNISKTNFMVFGTQKFDKNKFTDSIRIENCIIDQVDVIKFLGVYIDSKLSWKHHISQLSLTISRNIGVLYKLRQKLPDSAMLTLYNALILPHLMYCIVVWGCAGKSQMDRLRILQKRSIRIITNSIYNAHTSPLFLKLRTLKLEDIFILQILLFVFNTRYPPCAKNVCSFFYRFQFYYSFSNYSIRPTKKRLYVPYFRTEVRRHSISCIGAILFNKFPLLTEATSFVTMKKQIKLHFMNSF